ncbi:hypothetical protein [Oleisolibacter albus]|uniref:hypothetical protein n=1 Tax=Oleisolibacter albus TaxID=2171757 RepID=UPI0012D736F4|nr:hypothetical protein [Oleisolibacter albus]
MSSPGREVQLQLAQLAVLLELGRQLTPQESLPVSVQEGEAPVADVRACCCCADGVR